MFKENDFVVIGNEIAIIKDGNVLFDDGLSMPYNEESNIKLWKPSFGSVCWFYNKRDTHRVLARFYSEYNNKYYTSDLLDEISFDYCEPYIQNQLPYEF